MAHPNFEGVDTCGPVHVEQVNDLFLLASDIHIVKERKYKGSWAARGLHGAWMTMVRPYDRVNNEFESEEGNITGRIFTLTIFEGLFDASVYFMKMAAVIVKKNPGILKAWIDKEFKDEPWKLEYLDKVPEWRMNGGNGADFLLNNGYSKVADHIPTPAGSAVLFNSKEAPVGVDAESEGEPVNG